MNRLSPAGRKNPAAGGQSRREFLLLMAAASATVAISIDAMLPAFGELREYLGLSSDSSSVALVVTVFIGGLGVGQLVYGPLADRFGRKPVFIAGLILYSAAGFATTFATSLSALLVGRFFWGLGAAGPRIVSQALLRDRFRGDVLARAMAVILTVFLIVPTLAPILGQTLLHFGSWRYTFAVGPVFGIIVALWATRLSESLKPSDRRPIDIRSLSRTVLEILKTRRTLGNAIALMVMSAAFLPYLASSERMYGEIYGRADTFFLFFAASAIVMAGFTMTSARFVMRFGVRRTTAGAIALLMLVATVNLAATVISDGVPWFVFFFIATTVLISLNTAMTPLLTSSALDEVGFAAGTAASTIGVISLVGGALLSPLVDTAISTTVTPFALGFFVFGLIAALAVAWANKDQLLARIT
ncbi:MAG: multidrug effflux MFS transporter [Actinomycetia bacterium]|nr:multidrug effflux MFS transporter [Actinomycetes bacterium]